MALHILKRDVTNTYELQKYINNYTSSKVNRLFHYTSYESLVMMLTNKSIRLSRHDLLNDKAEESLSRCEKNQKRYIISFSNSPKEYVSMWAMYGKASGIKLRIDFPRQEFHDSINDNFYFDSEKTKKIPLSEIEPNQINKKGFNLQDVAYYDKLNNQIKHNGNSFDKYIFEDVVFEELAGFIKYDAWEFERETRLGVLLESNQDNTVKNIYANLNDELICEMSITYNPWISSELMTELQRSINNLAQLDLQHNLSVNNGEIAELK